MKRLLLPLFFIFSLFTANAQQQSVAIGSQTVNDKAVLWLNSPGKNQGLIIPIVSKVEDVGASSTEKGMIVYSLATNKIHYHTGTDWLELGGGSGTGGVATYGLKLNGNELVLEKDGTAFNTIKISDNAPAPNSLLIWDGSKWVSASLSGDVTNANEVISVNGLKGKAIPALPSTTQALVYNGTNWVFQTIGGSGTVTNIATGNGLTGGPITTTGTISVNVGTGSNQIPQLDATGKLLPAVLPTAIDANAADDITTATTAGGDLTGTYPNPTVGRIQGRAISNTAPADLQVLKWSQTNNRWEPSADNTAASPVTGNLTTTTTGLSITGGTNAVLGTGTTVNIQNATTSQPGLLTSADWNTFNTKVGSASNPAAGDITGSYTAGFQLGANAVGGTEIANGTVTVAKLVTAGAGDANKVFSTNGSGTPQLETKANFLSGTLTTGTVAGGDLTGTYPNPTIATSSGNNIVNAINDAATTGFVNTAKLSTSVVLDSESPAGGDINGSYSGGFQLAPNVIMDADISSSAAITGTKISPNFGSQNVTTSGTVDTKTIRLTGEMLLDSGVPNAGTAGQILTSAGPGLVPTWTTSASSFSTLNTIPRGDGSALGSSSIFDDGTFTGVGTISNVSPGSSRFDIQTSFGSATYGGMYIKTTELDGKPFYGYATAGVLKGWTYIDGTDSYKWKLNVGLGLPKVTVDGAGNMGIGVETPINKLDVEGGAVIGATYSGTNTAPVNGMLVEGNVGIGTTSPSGLLDVEASTVSTSSITAEVRNNYAGASTKYGINNNVSIDGTGIRYGIANTVYAPAGSGSALYSSYTFANHAGSGTTYGYYADINKAATQAGSLYGMYVISDNDGTGDSYLLYASSIGSTTGTEYGLYTTGEDYNYFSGNVGLGLANPGEKLVVYNATNPTIRATSGTTTTAANAANSGTIELLENTGTFGTGAIGFRMRYDGSSNNFFISSGVNTTVTNHVIIDRGAQRVGIHRNPTTNDLEVEGEASKTVAGSWIANSDRRIKTNIEDIENSFELVKKLRPVKFQYTAEWKKKHPSIKDHYYYNFIAQEFQEVFPEAAKGSGEFIDGDSREILQIDTYNAQIVTIKAVQELIKKVEDLEKENAQLKAEKSSLELDLKAEIAEIKKALGIEAKANTSISQNK